MSRNVMRLTSLLVLLFYINPISVLGQGMFNVKGEKNKALYLYSFFNITETSVERCMAKCLENCSCMSFQICDHEECQLCSSHKKRTPSAFRKRKGCTYYDFQRDLSKGDNQQCQKSCSTKINCCMTSNPCKNNGVCKPVSKTNSRVLFRCKCPAGYVGNSCQHPAKSCRDYINGNRVPGKYKVLDNNMKPFDVFCDFDSNSTLAWTLIQSYELQNKDQFQNPFLVDNPVNQDSPVWESYRLSKLRMESIQQDSNKWRLTCQYNSEGVVYRDYVRAANDKINILTYDSDACQEVEYIDIRGQNCTKCTSLIVQELTNNMYPLHIDSYYSLLRNCAFHPHGSLPCGASGEDNFGFYACKNSLHRCSADSTSTSQTWFGGY